MSDSTVLTLVGLMIALAAGLLGIFVVSRRMSLVADALSHVSLPGVSLALRFGFDPFLGALGVLIFAVLGIEGIQRRRPALRDTLIGVTFTAALAVGILVGTDEGLLESLFGSIEKMDRASALTAILGGLFILGLTAVNFQRFAIITFSSEIAASEGISVKRSNLLFLLLLALAVAIGIKAIGVLLMGALIILPAATARNLSRSLRAMTGITLAVSAADVLLGFRAAEQFNLLPGPTVVVVGALIFLVSLLIRPAERHLHHAGH